MKKRSLFAAVAMLIVSAIVLTSATYAWFSTTEANSIQSFGSTTSSGAAGLFLSTDTVNWKSTLTFNDYNYTGGGSTGLPANPNVLVGSWDATLNDGAGGYAAGDNALRPVTAEYVGAVSGNAASSYRMKFKGGDMVGTNFTLNAGEASQGYLKYVTYMLPKADGTITLTPNFSSTYNYVYYAIFVKQGNTVKKVWDSAANSGAGADGTDDAIIIRSAPGNASTGDSYNAITTTATSALTCVDTDGDGIINATEKNANMTLVAQPSSGAYDPFSRTLNATSGKYESNESITIGVTNGQQYSATVYVWAEGQDSDCISNGTVNTFSVDLDVAFAVAS